MQKRALEFHSACPVIGTSCLSTSCQFRFVSTCANLPRSRGLQTWSLSSTSWPARSTLQQQFFGCQRVVCAFLIVVFLRISPNLRQMLNLCQSVSGRFSQQQGSHGLFFSSLFFARVFFLVAEWNLCLHDVLGCSGRWDLASLASRKTCVYKPNALTETSEMKKVSVGAMFASNYHKLPRNQIAGLVWEAGQLDSWF